MKIASVVLAAALAPLLAQEIKLPPSIEKLAEKAEESVDVTLSKSMLQMAARFLSDKDSEEAKAKKIVAGLESVSVRSFEFAREGEYNPADVDAIRAQLQAPAWSRFVGARSKRSGQNADVYFKDAPGGQLGGIVVIAAEPTRLTIVNLIGRLDAAQLADLGGQFGIPRLDLSNMHFGRRDWK